MNVLSLFDGISCGMLALQRAGIKVDNYFASEIDENAIAISEKNHKNIIRLGDVTKWKEWELPKIDLVIGGSPCQGFSRAGKCLNFEDPRSKLFFEYVDILNSIKEKNPDVKFLLKNVKMKNEWKDVISEYLGVEPIEINSSLVSGQNRSRMYWTNIEGVEQPEDKNINLLDLLDDVSADESFIRSQYGILFDKSISEASRNLVYCADGEVRIKQSVKCGYIVAENGDGINISFPTSKSRRGRVIKGKSSTLDCACNIGVFHNGMIRRFTIRELERLQTLPEGYTEGSSETAAKKAIGNGWTVDVIAHILTNIKEKECKEMELRIEPITFPEVIKFNFDELKQEITDKVAMYNNLVYTEEQVKEAKTDRAALNKFVKALSDERIKIKKQCLQPYEEFEKRINELSSIVNEPINLIDKQVKEFEEKKKQEKMDAIKEYWNGLEVPEGLALEEIYDQKWLNASTSMKSIQETIDAAIDKFKTDMASLANLPEYSFEAQQMYISTLDVGKALNEAHRLSEMAKKKAAQEETMRKISEEQKAKEEMAKFMHPPVEEVDPDIQKKIDEAGEPTAPEKQWLSFRALLNVDDALALKQFFNDRNITFVAI